MILVIGGHGAGKLEYVKSLGYSESELSSDAYSGAPVLYGLQDIAARDPEGSMELLPALLNKRVVVCDEVGSGVIPANRSDREAREAAGRLCIALAREAERVVRLVAGIPAVIK